MGFEARGLPGEAASRPGFFEEPPRPPETNARRTPQRVALARNGRRLRYDVRLRFWLLGLSLPVALCIACLTWLLWHSAVATAAATAGTAVVLALLTSSLFEQITRPMQTLANVVSALREDDFSFRARGARRGDSLGDLALEINSLANRMQAQRGVTRDALTLAERVMGAMRTPVLAFAADGSLRLLNPAAESAFSLSREQALGRSATSLGLDSLFGLADGALHAHPAVSGVAGETRWSLRRSSFRLGGLPHQLFVLSDVNAALREEERLAWQRLIRVLSHEINNSLTPITSIAGSLRARLTTDARNSTDHTLRSSAEVEHQRDLRRGLQLIEERALSLHHFLQAYQQLTRLPRPSLQPVRLPDLVRGVVALETRLPVAIEPGPPCVLQLDPAQIEQLLINLLRNAVEAALSQETPSGSASVRLRWSIAGQELALQVEDNGPGVTETANLFVPFYTTKPAGTGIGLALAKQIASGHGGTLTLANREGASGCVAELRLPLSAPAAT